MVAVVLLLSGCAVGPDFLNPPPPDVSGYTPKPLPAQTGAADDVAGAAQRFAIGRDIPGDWWHLFGSPPLRSLVERALHNNPDLAAAQAALRVARANMAAGQGAFFPNIDGGLGASRQQNGVASPTGIAPETSTFNLFTGQVQVSYSPDVFGGVAAECGIATGPGGQPALPARGNLSHVNVRTSWSRPFRKPRCAARLP